MTKPGHSLGFLNKVKNMMKPGPSSGFFNKAKTFTITGGTFNEIHGDVCPKLDDFLFL